MLDSIWIRSPFISELDATGIEKYLKSRLLVENISGSILSEFVSETIKVDSATHASYVRVELRRTYFKEGLQTKDGRKTPPVELPCDPYLYLNFSLPKYLFGQNVILNNYDIWDCQHVLNGLEAYLGVKLPSISKWYVQQFDFSQCYKFTEEEQRDYIHSLSFGVFSRRNKHHSSTDTSLLWVGSIGVTKIYMKGAEQRANNKKKLIQNFGLEWTWEFLQFCDNILRLEVNFKKQGIKTRFHTVGSNPYPHVKGCIPVVKFPTNAELIPHFEGQISKIIKVDTMNSKTIDDAVLIPVLEKRFKRKDAFERCLLYVNLCREHGQKKADELFIRDQVSKGKEKSSSVRMLQRYRLILLDEYISISQVEKRYSQHKIEPVDFKYHSNKALGLFSKIDIYHVKKCLAA